MRLTDAKDQPQSYLLMGIPLFTVLDSLFIPRFIEYIVSQLQLHSLLLSLLCPTLRFLT